jgi:hypothetical protein
MKGPLPKVTNYPRLLQDGELAKLVIAFALSRGLGGFTEDEAKKIMLWAEWTAFQWQMLQLALKGLITLDIENADTDNYDDLTFRSVLSHLGLAGIEAYQQTLDEAARKVSKMDTLPASSGKKDDHGEGDV